MEIQKKEEESKSFGMIIQGSYRVVTQVILDLAKFYPETTTQKRYGGQKVCQ